MQCTRQWRYWTLALTLLGAHVAAAQGSDTAALQQEIATLRQTVEQLVARVAAVERQLALTPPVADYRSPSSGPVGVADAPAREPTATPRPEAILQDRWGHVERGMTLAAIETLLGRPDRTLHLENKTVWLYTYAGIGNGSIVFDADGSVTDWQNPPFHQWW